MMFEDLVDAKRNADAVEDAIVSLGQNRERLAQMAAALKETCPLAGADTVAQWLDGQIGEATEPPATSYEGR